MSIWELVGVGSLFACVVTGTIVMMSAVYLWSARSQRLSRAADAERERERERLRLIARTAQIEAQRAVAAAAAARAGERLALAAAEDAVRESLRITLPRRRASAVPWGSFDPAVPVPALVAIDVETTGLDPKVDRITEVAFFCHDGSSWRSFVNPERPIPDSIRELTGITDADVANAPTFGQVWDEVKRLRLLDGRFPVAYNAKFDQEFMVAELVRASRPDEARVVMDLEWIDPCLIVRSLDEGSAKLEDACERWGVASPTHRALDDARACLALFLELERATPRFTGRALGIALQEQIASRGQRKR